ncbi:MAG: copper homeostasis protein CutC [Labilibaculum antarcticum]
MICHHKTDKKVCEKLSIPIVSIIQPREGDFNYSMDEFEIIIEDIQRAKEPDCFGLPLDVLKKMKQLLEFGFVKA